MQEMKRINLKPNIWNYRALFEVLFVSKQDQKADEIFVTEQFYNQWEDSKHEKVIFQDGGLSWAIMHSIIRCSLKDILRDVEQTGTLTHGLRIEIPRGFHSRLRTMLMREFDPPLSSTYQDREIVISKIVLQSWIAQNVTSSGTSRRDSSNVAMTVPD